MSRSAYRPFQPARRPGGKPPEKPRYRVLVHRRYADVWEQLPERVGLENAQQFYDHVAETPGSVPHVGTSCMLRGKAGKPQAEGWSRTIHYEISGAGRIDYQFHDAHKTSPDQEPHRVVAILTIDLGSH